jgi:hypothetical protein
MGLAVLLAACAPSASETPTPSPEPTGAPSPSEAAATCDPGVVCDGPLPAGHYSTTSAGAHVEFTLDEHDWSGMDEAGGVGFGLFLADVGGTHAISVLKFSPYVFTDACSGEGTSIVGNSPAEFMAFLIDRHGITASEPVPIEVGGRPALQVDLTTEVDAACMAADNERIWLWQLPTGYSPYFVDAERARVIAVDSGSGTVVILIEALPEADYDHLLEHATEVIDSMVIEPL